MLIRWENGCGRKHLAIKFARLSNLPNWATRTANSYSWSITFCLFQMTISCICSFCVRRLTAVSVYVLCQCHAAGVMFTLGGAFWLHLFMGEKTINGYLENVHDEMCLSSAAIFSCLLKSNWSYFMTCLLSWLKTLTDCLQAVVCAWQLPVGNWKNCHFQTTIPLMMSTFCS